MKEWEELHDAVMGLWSATGIEPAVMRLVYWIDARMPRWLRWLLGERG